MCELVFTRCYSCQQQQRPSVSICLSGFREQQQQQQPLTLMAMLMSLDEDAR
jgi:hypothetical protein